MFAPSQSETSLQSKVVSHWLGANLESSLEWQVVWTVKEYDIQRFMKLVLTTETHQKAKEHYDLFVPSVEWVEWNVIPILTDTVGYYDMYNSIISTTVNVKAHV